MKKFISSLLVISTLMVSLAGCGSTTSSSTAANTSSASTSSAATTGTLQSMIDSNDEYIAVCCLNNIEYFNSQKYGWEQAGKLFDVKTSWVGPADGDVNAMVTAFNTAVAKNPAGITVWGYDPALKPSIDAAEKAGINVVTFVGDIEDSSRISYVGSSQYDIGYNGAVLYAKSINGKGKIAIMTLPGNQMFEERTSGFLDGFKKYPDISVVAQGDTKADSVTAISAAKDILNKNPDLTGFVCCDSTGAMGASTAVKEMNMVGKVQILGMDRNSDILNLIKDGTLTGSIVQNDISMSYWAMVQLITAKYYDVPLTSDNKAAGVNVAPSSIYTSVNMVTKDNVDYFLDQNKVYATNNF